MPSINSKRTAGDKTGAQRLQQILRSPALPFILGQINPALGMVAGLGRGAMNVGQRIGYMFDGDDTTGFWRGENRGQPMFGNARDAWAGLFGGGRGEAYSGPPALQGPGNRWESPSEADPFTPEDYARATSSGNWGGSSGQQGDGQGPRRPASGDGIGGRSLASMNAALRYIQTAPTGWRGHGIPGRIGLGGNQDTGIGAFNGPTDIGNSRGTIQYHNNVR